MGNKEEDFEFLVKTLHNLVKTYAAYLAESYPDQSEDRVIEELLRQLDGKFIRLKR